MLNDEEIDALRRPIAFEAVLLGRTFSLRSTWGLFSPREIDDGTRLLLEYLQIEPDHDCFDLGCGYGPIGLALAGAAPQGKTVMVDKDFVAVEHARINVERNRVRNAEVVLSNGFAQVDPKLRFDRVVSNIPAKVGKELLSILLHDARARLRPGGRIYVVTVNGLRQYIKRNFNEVFGNYKKLKQGLHYTVAMAEVEYPPEEV